MSELQPITTFSGCFLASFRNLAGPGLLLAMGGVLIADRPRIGSVLDLLFIAVALATVAAGLAYRPPAPAPGEEAGLSRKAYVVTIAALSTVVWGLVHGALRR